MFRLLSFLNSLISSFNFIFSKFFSIIVVFYKDTFFEKKKRIEKALNYFKS